MTSYATRLASTLLVCCGSAFVSACGDCAPVGRPAFALEIVDFDTGSPAATGVAVHLFRYPGLARVSTDSAQDSVRVYAGWGQEPGVYDVLVEREGYWPWTAANKQVVEDLTCSTKTVNLSVRLRRRA